MQIEIIGPEIKSKSQFSNEEIVEFLFVHLGKYGDSKFDINRCLTYIFEPNRGGFIVLASVKGDIIGAVAVNYTGMSGYIPENILVYIAVHEGHRGKGIGRKLMQAAIQQTEGNIALHVEPDNPARYLYENLGFSNRYLEMRLVK